MSGRWLISLGVWLTLAAMARAQTAGLLVTREHPTHYHQPASVPYLPQPGDIVLFDDLKPFYNVLFKLAGTAPPVHTSIVIAGADGKPALLELTGPRVLTARVLIMDVNERLRTYSGIIEVRRLRQPLTPEQSSELTRFAQAQVGKAFAWPRVLLQGTPFCARTGLRKDWFGHTYLDRNRWFCSELVVAACATAKIVDGKRCCANATLPRDLAVDQWLDLSPFYHPPVRWMPDAFPTHVNVVESILPGRISPRQAWPINRAANP